MKIMGKLHLEHTAWWDSGLSICYIYWWVPRGCSLGERKMALVITGRSPEPLGTAGTKYSHLGGGWDGSKGSRLSVIGSNRFQADGFQGCPLMSLDTNVHLTTNLISSLVGATGMAGMKRGGGTLGQTVCSPWRGMLSRCSGEQRTSWGPGKGVAGSGHRRTSACGVEKRMCPRKKSQTYWRTRVHCRGKLLAGDGGWGFASWSCHLLTEQIGKVQMSFV